MPLPAALVLGHVLIDSQHDHLLELIAGLHQPHQRESAIGAMITFMHRHFRDEEAAIAGCDHETAVEHSATHRVIVMQVLDIVAQMKAGACADNAARAISAILLEHIVTEDRPLKRLFGGATS